LRTARLPDLLLAAAGALVLAVALAVGARTSPADGYLAAVGVAALLGAAVVAVRIDPAVTISCGLALSVFSGHWSYLGLPIGADRIVVVAGIAIAAWRDLRSEHPRIRTTWLHVLLALIAIYAVGNSTLAGTLRGTEPFFGLTDYLGLVPFALFWVAPAAFGTERQRNVLLVPLTVLGAYLGLTAIVETTGPSSLVWPKYILDPSVGIHLDRARGPFAEAAANGLALYFCAVAAAVGLARWRSRLIALLVIGACVAGLLFTVTRQAWIAAILGTGAAMLSERSLRRWLIPAGVAALVTIVALLSFVPGISGHASNRAADKLPVWSRLASDAAALRMIQAEPLHGFGWYRFGSDSPPYYRLARNYPMFTVGRPHNVFLAYAAELGVLALVAWLSALAWALVGALRRRGPPELAAWRAGLVAIAVAWLVVANFTPMGYAFVHSMLWLWAGVCWAAPTLERRS
jgi:putative inorganic carbon (HCO3(-)) transporter